MDCKSSLTHCENTIFKKQKAFTLAEVLITLGIIGIVAALTIPGLMTAYKAIELRARFNEAHSLISQAIKLMQKDGVSTFPEDYANGAFKPVFIQYFKSAIDCGEYQTQTNIDFCFSTNKLGGSYNDKTYKNYSKKTFINTKMLDDGQFVLNNGMLIAIENEGKYGGTPNSGNILISVDINGKKSGPNAWGHDLFTFILDKSSGELKPMTEKGADIRGLASASGNNNYCSTTWSYDSNGIGCTAKAISDSGYFWHLPK